MLRVFQGNQRLSNSVFHATHFRSRLWCCLCFVSNLTAWLEFHQTFKRATNIKIVGKDLPGWHWKSVETMDSNCLSRTVFFGSDRALVALANVATSPQISGGRASPNDMYKWPPQTSVTANGPLMYQAFLLWRCLQLSGCGLYSVLRHRMDRIKSYK